VTNSLCVNVTDYVFVSSRVCLLQMESARLTQRGFQQLQARHDASDSKRDHQHEGVMAALAEMRALLETVTPSNLALLMQRCTVIPFHKQLLMAADFHTGTRRSAINEFQHWLNSDCTAHSARVFAISAPAGSGRSTLAAMLCEMFPTRILAVHFASAEHRSTHMLIRSSE
jgi:hypothetical protein